MSSEEVSNKEEESNTEEEKEEEDEKESNPKSKENNETNSITNESTERVKKEKKFLGKKTEREGKKINHDYCSSCLKKGKLLLCEDCERAYHMKCLNLEEKNIPEGPWLCPICSLKKEKQEKKEKKNKKIKKEIKNVNIKKEPKKEAKKENKKEVKKDTKNTNNKKDIKKKEKTPKKKLKENNEDTEEEKEEKEDMELDEEKETTEKNDNSNEEKEKNENTNESNENEDNNESNENQEEEKENKKENIKKKKVKKKGKKVASKKNSGDKSDKSEKSEKRERTPDKKKEKEKQDKTPDKSKKEKADKSTDKTKKEKEKEKTPNKDNKDKDKFAITTIKSKRLQEKQKQKEKERLEKERLEKEKKEKEKEKDKTPEKEKPTTKQSKKKGGVKPKKIEQTEYKDSSDNKNSGSSNDEEIYTDDVVNNSNNNSNTNIKSELLSFFKKSSMKEIKNNTLEKLNLSEEILNLLKDEKGVKDLTNMVKSDKSFNKYKSMFNALVDKISFPSDKTSHQKIIHYPIRCKELYSTPDLYNLEEKYLNKTNGILYPYFNGKIFNRVIGIYDFLSTFANKIYLDKFSLEEFYSALLKSDSYTRSEIGLLSSIHVSLCYLLLEELLEYPIQDLYSNGETELLMVKEVVEYKREDLNKIYAFIYYSWPELVRLFLKSKTFSKDISIEVNYELLPVLEKIYKCSNVIEYNTSLNFEEKLLVLENLVIISYETNFIREIVKEANDSLNKYKKQKRDLEEELKYLDSRKTEFERHNKLTQPQNRIDEINQKLGELGQNKTRSAADKMRLKLENEKQVLEDMIREMGENNVLREDNLAKLKEIKTEIFEVQTIGRTNLGVDGRGYKYFYFNWMPKFIFFRAKGKHFEEKYEWRIINDLDILKNDLIDKLSEKGIEELELKSNLEIIYKKLTDKIKENSKENKVIMDEEKEDEKDEEKEKEDDKNKNNQETKMEIENEEKNEIKKEKPKEEFIPQSLDYIFDNQVLKYENGLNPNKNISISTSNTNTTSSNKQNRIILITNETNQYEPICDRVKKLEINMTKYLCLDNRQWESQANRGKIKAWISTINSLKNFINILLFFHERIKIPYKSETLSFADFIFGKSATRKIIEEEKEEDESEGETKNKSCPLIVNGNLDYNYINRDLTYANRIKLWTKEFETFNIEKIYLEYLKKVKNIPQYLICLSLFEMMIIELNKRRDMCKRKGDNFIPEIVKNDENKNNGENNKDNYNKIVIKKPDVKKRKLIQWNVKCMYCHEFGELLCCEECPNVAHLACAKLNKLPDAWKCSFCVDNMKI